MKPLSKLKQYFVTRKTLAEETVLFFSVLKWLSLGAFIGTIVGLSTALFLTILNSSIKMTNAYSYYFLLLPIGLTISTLLTMYLAPEAEGHGTEKVIEAVHKRSGKIKPAVVPVKLLATVTTISSGGSAGKEGPCAQIGAGLASFFADLFKFKPHERKKLVICGISAGFASVFGTPIAGAIFGVEVLYAGSILYEVLLPSFIAGIVSYHVTSAFGITYFHQNMNFVPAFDLNILAYVTLAGIFFGLCARLLIGSLHRFKRLADNIHVWKPLKAILGGFVLIFLTLIFSPQFLGLGTDTINSCLEGEDIVWYAFILKIIFTAITLNFGGSGGIVTPIFFIGATSGSLFAKLLGLSPSTFSAIGLVALLAGAANTPISASIMAVELFGPGMAPYACIACVISFIMTGHASVYPSQVLAIKKSASFEVETGKEIDRVSARLRIGKKSKVYMDLIVKRVLARRKQNKG